VIVLDTHIWIWWVQNDGRLTQQQQDWIDSYQSTGLNDPADQIIVATAKVYDCPLLTADNKILNYSGCETLGDGR